MTTAIQQAFGLLRLGTADPGPRVDITAAVPSEGLEGLGVANAQPGGSVPAAWKQMHAATAATTTIALQELAAALRELHAQGFEVLMLPGAALLRLYPDGGCRPMDDVDLLCPPDHLDAIAQALVDFGWTTVPRYPDLLSGRHVHVDLHDDLFHCGRIEARRQAGWLDPTQVWSRRRRIVVEGIEVWGLCAADEVLYTAAHALRHSYRRITWLIDLALQLRAEELDIRSLRSRAEASGLARSVLFGVSLLHAAGVDLPESVSAWYLECAPGRMSARLLHWILAARQSTSAGEVLWYWTCPSRRDRLRLMTEFVFPRPDVLLQVFPQVARRLAPIAYALRCGQLVMCLVRELVTMTLIPLTRKARRG
jgi:hypothetical protein